VQQSTSNFKVIHALLRFPHQGEEDSSLLVISLVNEILNERTGGMNYTTLVGEFREQFQ
jgi:hypothetical protein